MVVIFANIILAPKFGAVGAGLSTAESYIMFFTLRTSINLHYYVYFDLTKFYLLTFVALGFAVYNSF